MPGGALIALTVDETLSQYAGHTRIRTPSGVEVRATDAVTSRNLRMNARTPVTAIPLYHHLEHQFAASPGTRSHIEKPENNRLGGASG